MFLYILNPIQNSIVTFRKVLILCNTLVPSDRSGMKAVYDMETLGGGGGGILCGG